MLELAERAVREALAAGADHADARVVRSAAELLRVRDGATVEAAAPTEFGLGVRALVNGAFGFAAVPGSPRELGDLAAGVARRAARGARELATTRRQRTVLAPAAPHHVAGDGGGAHTPVAIDPFAVTIEEKLALLFELDAALAAGPDIQSREAHLTFVRDERWVATSDGTGAHRVRVRSGAGLGVVAAANGRVEQRRFAEGPVGPHEAALRDGGYEVLAGLGLRDAAVRVREEARALCAAKACRPGRRTVVLSAATLAFVLRETLGRAVELDRVLDEDLDGGGRSFLTTEDVERRRVGAPCVGVEWGARALHGSDDEGVPLRRRTLVRDGVLVGFVGGRAHAGHLALGDVAGGAAADGWWSPPLVRATDLTLAAGDLDRRALLAGCEDGALLLDTVRAWSRGGRGFELTCEVGYEVRGGSLRELVRAPRLRASAQELWGACDAVADAGELRAVGWVDGPKGRPSQAGCVSVVCAPARFRGLEVLAT